MKTIFTLFFTIPFLAFSQWQQYGNQIDGTQTDDFFGQNVSISANGNTIAVSARGYEIEETKQGIIRVFENLGNQWVQKGNDIFPNTQDEFYECGYATVISKSGNTLVVSSRDRKAYVFEYNNNNWIQKGQTLTSPLDEESLFGTDVSINADGSVIAVSDPYADAGNLKNAGIVYIYKYNNSNWELLGESIKGKLKYDRLGDAIDMDDSGTIIAIGSPDHDGFGGSSHAEVYEFTNNSWTRRGQNIKNQEFDDTGKVISINADGTILALTSDDKDNDNIFADFIRVYSFSQDTNTWEPLGSTLSSDEIINSLSLNASGYALAVGASLYNDNYARVYNYNKDWKSTEDIVLENLDDSERKLRSVSLNADGTILGLGVSIKESLDFPPNELGFARVYTTSSLNINNTNFKQELSLYPNPSGYGETNIVFKKSHKSVLITVYNALGKQINTTTHLNTNQVKLKTNYPAGLYFINVLSGDKTATLKLLIE